MGKKKLEIRVFTIADYEEEEIWLRQMQRSGWKLEKTIPPCFYIFERCVPEDVVYRLDYTNGRENSDYFQMFRDYGWEYFNRCAGWLYFRKSASAADTEEDAEIFSDDASRVELVNHVVKTRMLPLLLAFFCCVLPGFIWSVNESSAFADGFAVVFALLFLLYLYLFLHCGGKLRKLKKKYSRE